MRKEEAGREREGAYEGVVVAHDGKRMELELTVIGIVGAIDGGVVVQ